MNDELQIDKQRERIQYLTEVLKNTHKKENELYLIRGKVLKEIRDDNLFKYMGDGGYDTFSSYLADPEIDIALSTAYAYISVYTYFIEERGMTLEAAAEIPFNRLRNIMPKVREMPKEKADEVIEKTKTLSFKDYKQEMQEAGIEDYRPLVIKHPVCGKYQVQYNPLAMCDCEGHLHIDPKLR